MSENKAFKPAKSKAQFIAENLAKYNTRFSFLPAQQIKGKLESDWRRLYGPQRAKPIVKPIIKETAINKPTPKVLVKPEILITPVPTEQLIPDGIVDDGLKSKLKDNEIENAIDKDEGGNYGDDHGNLKPKIKRKPVREPSNRVLRSRKDKLETTIELLSEDNQSVGFIERKGTSAYLKLHNGKIIPWSHSTPVRQTRTNTHLRDITRLPFSPI